MEVGDVRFLLPCYGRHHLRQVAAGRQRMTKRTSRNNRQGTLRRATPAFNVLEPNETVLVLVLGGFVISTETNRSLRERLASLPSGVESEAALQVSLSQGTSSASLLRSGDSGSDWKISADSTGDEYVGLCRAAGYYYCLEALLVVWACS